MTTESSVRTPLPAAPVRHALRLRLARLGTAIGRLVSSNPLSGAALAAKAVVFAPHPDDEVLGCGGTIALKVDAGAPVELVFMTDGRTSHAAFIDAAELVRMRRHEAERAAARLGLAPSACTFLEIEDTCLGEYASRAQQQVAEILRRTGAAQVFVPHRRDGLSDHVATFEIVQAALLQAGHRASVFEYPVWLWHTWPWTEGNPKRGSGWRSALGRLRDAAELSLGCRSRVDVRPVLQRKLTALAEYRSQMQRHGDDARWPVLGDVADGAFLDRFVTGFEIFRVTPARS